MKKNINSFLRKNSNDQSAFLILKSNYSLIFNTDINKMLNLLATEWINFGGKIYVDINSKYIDDSSNLNKESFHIFDGHVGATITFLLLKESFTFVIKCADQQIANNNYILIYNNDFNNTYSFLIDDDNIIYKLESIIYETLMNAIK